MTTTYPHATILNSWKVTRKNMHNIQQKILNLAENHNLADFTLRKIGELVNEPGSPQKIKHHLDQLIGKGLLVVSADGKEMKKIRQGLDDSSQLVSLPILGSANCGQALCFADDKIEGYLKISSSLLSDKLINKIKDLFVLKAVGNSMNRASVDGKNIENGDYVIIDKNAVSPKSGDYVISNIDGTANIKRFYADRDNNQLVLISESSQDFPPIYIHESDFINYMVCGRVVGVMKRPDELALMRQASAHDILRDLGPISKEEVDYYKNL